MSSSAQPCARAHCNTSRCPIAAASEHVRAFLGVEAQREIESKVSKQFIIS
jgi:hypothetical protein